MLVKKEVSGLHKQEVITNFSDLCVVMQNSIVTRYREYDNYQHCYYSIENSLAFLVTEPNGEKYINLRNGKTGVAEHTIKMEPDFEVAVVEYTYPSIKVVIRFKSKYEYHILLRKIE